MAKTSITAKLGLDTTAFQRGLARSQKSIGKFAKSATASFVRMGAAFAGIGLVKSIIGLGTSAAETASKFKAVFGPAADSMNEKVQELRKTIPSTTAQMQNALSTFAAMAKGFGLNAEAANIFSVEMVKLAGDVASFHDLKTEEAFLKIRSAISGEFEPMKQLGVVINQARMEQEGLNLAIWDGTGQMSAAQKALAVQSILIRDLGDANGDAAATADSAANRIKFLKAELEETGTKIGTTALPAILNLTDGLSQMLSMLERATSAAGKFTAEIIYMGKSSKRQEIEDEVNLRKEAIRLLKEEGKIREKSSGFAFSKEARQANLDEKKLIEEKVAAMKAEKNAEIARLEKVEADRKSASEKAISESKDLAGELEKQAAAEKDPARKKALEDRLEAYKKLLVAAGKLESITRTSTSGGAGTKGAKSTAMANAAEMKKTFDNADTNKDSIITGRERRAQESADRKKASAARRARTMAVASESGANMRARAVGVDARFDEREKAAGLSGTIAGRDTVGMSAQQTLSMSAGMPNESKAGNGKNVEQKQQKEQIEHLKEISKTLTKLDQALSGE